MELLFALLEGVEFVHELLDVGFFLPNEAIELVNLPVKSFFLLVLDVDVKGKGVSSAVEVLLVGGEGTEAGLKLNFLALEVFNCLFEAQVILGLFLVLVFIEVANCIVLNVNIKKLLLLQFRF